MVYKFQLEVFRKTEFWQIYQLTFEWAKVVLRGGIVQAVTLATRALANTFPLAHTLVLLARTLPALIRMENQFYFIWYGRMCLL